MSTELMVLTKEEIEKNPEVVGENLAKLASVIEECKSDIKSIKNRGFGIGCVATILEIWQMQC